jgi:hypothetical protein
MYNLQKLLRLRSLQRPLFLMLEVLSLINSENLKLRRMTYNLTHFASRVLIPKLVTFLTWSKKRKNSNKYNRKSNRKSKKSSRLRNPQNKWIERDASTAKRRLDCWVSNANVDSFTATLTDCLSNTRAVSTTRRLPTTDLRKPWLKYTTVKSPTFDHFFSYISYLTKSFSRYLC